jgi:hypothetical protein
MMMGGALSKVPSLSKFGASSVAVLMQMGDNYNDAIKEGFTPQQAGVFSTAASVLSGIVESIVPEGPPISTARLRDIIRAGGDANALKAGIRASLGEYLKNAGQEMTEENTEQIVSDVFRQIVGFDKDNLYKVEDYKNATLGAAMLSPVMTSLRGGKNLPNALQEIRYDIAGIDPSKVPNLKGEAKKMYEFWKDIRVAAESFPNWKELDRKGRTDLYSMLVEKKELEESAKELGTTALDERIAEIGKEIDETINSREIETDLDAGKQEFPDAEAVLPMDEIKEVATQDVNIKDEVLPTPTELLIANTEEVAKDERTEIEQTTEVEADVQQQGDESGAIQSEIDGGGDGLRDTGIDEPIDEGSPRDIKGLIFAEDEEIGRVLFGGDGIEPDGGMASGEVDMGGDKGDANVLPSEGEPNGDGSVSEEPVRVDVLGNGEDIKNLSERTTKVRAKLISKVNSLIDMASTYNGLGKKGRDTPVGKKMRERIEQDAKKMGLDYNFLGNKIKIGYKGKPIRKKGTTRGKSNEVEIISRARKMRSNGERQTDNLLLDIAEMFLTKTKKDKGGITPYLFGSLTMLDKDTEEYKNAVSMGWVDENGEGDLEHLTSSLNSHYNDNYDPDQVSDILSLVLGAGSRGALKAMVA